MKSLWRTSFAFVLALAMFAGTANAEAKPDTSLDSEVEYYLENNSGAEAGPDAFQMFWKNGFKGESGDGNTKIEIGGRLQFDMTFADSDDELGNSSLGENAVGFRRARFHIGGTVYKNTLFKLEIDFANGEVELRNAYVGLDKVGPGKLLVGHMKEPFSLEELTSSRFITFTERAASTQAFAPSYNSGIGWFGNLGEAKKIYLAAGSFFNTDEVQGAVIGQGGWGFVVRVGGLAIENKDRDMILWIGFDFRWSNYRMSSDGSQTVVYQARPQSGGDRFIGTDDIAAESDIRYAFEVAFQMKTIHVSAEFFWATPSVVGGGEDPTFSGFYAEIGWFITGESRPFKVSSGAWDRPKPKANFWTGDGGRGAMEVALRWDSTDLTDEAIEGGEMDTLTVGFNWWWNPNTRMMIDYVSADIEGSNELGVGTGKLNIVIVRWQIDF